MSFMNFHKSIVLSLRCLPTSDTVRHFAVSPPWYSVHGDILLYASITHPLRYGPPQGGKMLNLHPGEVDDTQQRYQCDAMVGKSL